MNDEITLPTLAPPATPREDMPQAKRPRQDPVSCELCRNKKLKCNREHPCSNCQARGVTCTLGNAVLPAPRGSGSVDTEAILSRLDRLEGLLLNNPNIRRHSSAAVSPATTHDTSSPSAVKHEAAKAAHDEALRIEGEQLYSTATRDKSSLFKNVYEVAVRISTVRDLIDNASASVDGAVGTTLAPKRLFWLPPKHEAIILMSDFKNHVDFSHHVVYLPQARRICDEVYSKLDKPTEIDPSHLGLLFAIFGSTAHYRSSQTKSRSLFNSDEEAFDICKVWIRHGHDALEISRHTGTGTLQDVQMCIVLCFVVFNLEGFSVRSRSLHSACLSIARDIGLHKIDSPEYKATNPEENHIITEIKRRLWWHIACTDWLLAISGGIQEGAYNVHPRHMWVNRPRNLTDEDLEREGPHFFRPMSEPTEMSYFLQRLRSAELARDIADAWPLGTSDIDQVDYNMIIETDAKFEEFFRDMPVFFRSDHESVRQSYHIVKRFPGFVLQKTLINLSIHMRRCKLHQPFLVRGSSDERFRYSRNACLRSAREVIDCKRRLDKEAGIYAISQLPLNLFVVHHLFVAIIVLVMDLCFNRIPEEEQERREEVIRACRTLESTRTQSMLAKRLLTSLIDVLRKHKINLTQTEVSEATDRATGGASASSSLPTSTEIMVGRLGEPSAHAGSLGAAVVALSDTASTRIPTSAPSDSLSAAGSTPAFHSHGTPDGAGAAMPPAQGMLVPVPAQQYGYASDMMAMDPMTANVELDGLWQSYVESGANLDAQNWDQLFSALEDPAGLATGWNGVPV